MAKIQLKDVRVTFPNLFEAKSPNGQGEPKFSASFLLAKDHPQKAEIERCIVTVAKEKWGERAQDVLKALKAADKLALHDGDAKSDYDGYAGMLFINASNKIRPLVIDGNRAPLTAADGKPYSGCYVNCILDIWSQDNQYGKRVNASLLGVQFLRDGDRLAGGSVAAADDFEPLPGADAAKVEKSGDGAASLF